MAIPDKKPLERSAGGPLPDGHRPCGREEEEASAYQGPDEQLKERRTTEEAAAETAFRQLYPAVWFPRVGDGGTLDLEKIEVGGRPLQATGIHERVMELLTAIGHTEDSRHFAPSKSSTG